MMRPTDLHNRSGFPRDIVVDRTTHVSIEKSTAAVGLIWRCAHRFFLSNRRAASVLPPAQWRI
jgi:hypothetical protein